MVLPFRFAKMLCGTYVASKRWFDKFAQIGPKKKSALGCLFEWGGVGCNRNLGNTDRWKISYWSQPCSVLLVKKCQKFAPIPILYLCQKFAVSFCFDSKKQLLTELREVLETYHLRRHWIDYTVIWSKKSGSESSLVSL